MHHGSRRAIVLTLGVLTILASSAAGVSAAGGQVHGPRPDGRVRALNDSNRHCDDLVPGRLECFDTALARDRAVNARIAASPASATSGGYVIAYVDASFGGSSVVLSHDYADLSTIGWNDRISSYKVFTELTGYFYSNSFYSGTTSAFCCFAQVAYVGNAANDTFSSIDLP